MIRDLQPDLTKTIRKRRLSCDMQSFYVSRDMHSFYGFDTFETIIFLIFSSKSWFDRFKMLDVLRILSKFRRENKKKILFRKCEIRKTNAYHVKRKTIAYHMIIASFELFFVKSGCKPRIVSLVIQLKFHWSSTHGILKVQL